MLFTPSLSGKSIMGGLAFLLASFLFPGCSKPDVPATAGITEVVVSEVPGINQPLISEMTVVNLQDLGDGSFAVMFSESPRIFFTSEISKISLLRKALQEKWMVRATYDAYNERLQDLQLLPGVALRLDPALLVPDPGFSMKVDLKNMDAELLNTFACRPATEKKPESTLSNVIPDIATAQMIFNYLVQQCCVLPGPTQLDYCIPFQYALDGCHARAHKMCWVINTKFHYDTHKIFSMANDQVGEWLSVEAQKWGGCCIKWWFHVAPLVNVNTPGGVKAYVLDPSMFDQPVLLIQWLNAQENSTCYSNPKVSKISLQPTSSYKPYDFFSQTFVQDPWYSYTNSTLSNYSTLTTCH